MEEDRHAMRSTVSRDGLTVMESYSPKFHDRTVENARWADLTVVDSNVDFPQIVIEKGATKRGIQR